MSNVTPPATPANGVVSAAPESEEDKELKRRETKLKMQISKCDALHWALGLGESPFAEEWKRQADDRFWSEEERRDLLKKYHGLLMALPDTE